MNYERQMKKARRELNELETNPLATLLARKKAPLWIRIVSLFSPLKAMAWEQKFIFDNRSQIRTAVRNTERRIRSISGGR